MSTLTILIGNQLGAPWDWGVPTREIYGKAVTSEDKCALAQLDVQKVCVVIPGMCVVTKHHIHDNLTPNQWRQASGFAIEDELATALGKNHITFDVDTQRLAVIARADMDALVEALDAVGVSADIICADYDSHNEMGRFIYNERLVDNSGNGLGFAIEENLSAQFVDKAQGVPAKMSGEQFIKNIAQSWARDHTPMNLRQGEYANSNRRGWQQYKGSAILAAILVLSILTVNLGQGLVYARKTANIQVEMEAIYSELFPNTKSNNIALSIIRAQSTHNYQKNDVFIKLSSILARSVQDVEGVEISTLRYDKTKEQLNLNIQYGSFEDVERVTQMAANNGGIFAEGSTRQNGDSLTGDATMKVAP